MKKDSEMYRELINAITGNRTVNNKFDVLNWLYAKYNAEKGVEEYYEAKEKSECAANAE